MRPHSLSRLLLALTGAVAVSVSCAPGPADGGDSAVAQDDVTAALPGPAMGSSRTRIGDRLVLGLRRGVEAPALRARLDRLGARLLLVREAADRPIALVQSRLRGRLALPADLVEWAVPATEEGLDRLHVVDPQLADEARTLLPVAEPADGLPEEPFEDPPVEPALASPPTGVQLLGDSPPFGGAVADTSRFMVGTVAVALLLPESTGEGDPSTEDWTPAEVALAQARAQSALAWLAETEPSGRLSFVLDLPSAPPPGGVPGTIATVTEPVQRFAAKGGWNFDEVVWADVLARVGPPGGFTSGSVVQRRLDYAHFLRQKHGTNWAIILMVADNSASRAGRASALLYGPAGVVFSRVGSSVYRHEIGHLFGARDEYHPDAAQSPSALHGWLAVANGNSQLQDGTGAVDGHGESVPSLMLNNVPSVNAYTRIAWGWLDSDGDGVQDLFDAPPRVTIGAPAGEGPWLVDVVASVAPFAPFGVPGGKGALSLDAVAAVDWRVLALSGPGPWTPVEPPAPAGEVAVQLEVPPLPEGTWGVEVRARTLEGQAGTVRAPWSLAVRRDAGPATTVLAGLVTPPLVAVGQAVTLDAASSAVLGEAAPPLYRWDLDGDGAWDTGFGVSPTAEAVFDAPGVLRPRVEVSAGGTSAVADAAVEVVDGDVPPDAAFTLGWGHAVGAGNDVTVTASPAPGIGRWDLDGDGQADTPWAPLVPAEVTFAIPPVRVAIRGSAPNADGYAWGAVAQRGELGWLVDAERDQVLAVDVADPDAPAIVAGTTLGGLSPRSDLLIAGEHLLVSRGTAGLTRLLAAPQGGALVGATDVGGLADAGGLAIAGEHVLASDGDGLVTLDAGAAPVGGAAHVAPGRIADLDASGPLGCAVVLEEEDPYAGALVVLDVASPEAPAPVAVVPLATLGGLHASAPGRVAAHDGLCVVADGPSGVRVFDAAGELLSTVDVAGNALHALVDPAGRLFVASGLQLHVADLTDPTAPAPVTAMALRSPRGLALGDDGLLHIAGGSSGYQIAEVLEGQVWRSGAFSVGLEVRQGAAVAAARRPVTAIAYGSPPTAALQATATAVGLTLDSGGSADPDTAPWDGLLLRRWDTDGDGAWDTDWSIVPVLTVPLPAPGMQRVAVQVRDRFWGASVATAEVCVPDAGGLVPAERCGNGRDDDCDSAVDEGFGELGEPCAVGQGACAAEGLWICEGGALVCGTTAPGAGLERCGDGVDDDCDGAVDEGFELLGEPCTVGQGACAATGTWACDAAGLALVCAAEPAAGSPEVCNGEDDDCDGEVDEGSPAPAGGCDGADAGSCAAGHWVCVAGALACVDDLHGGSPESCDGLDNDCDGLVDELWILGVECDGPDADGCRTGVQGCAPDGLGTVCVEDPANESPEICNGLDDDCDKLVDEGFVAPGTPCDGPDADLCKGGVAACTADGLGVVCDEPGAAAVEVCNGADDDCDGDVDEGFGVGEPCDGPDADLCALGLVVCVGPDAAACDEPGDGRVEVCNFADDDCDGAVDEGWPVGAPCDGPDADACEDGWLACDEAGDPVCFEPGPGAVELCNGVDDDCDGAVDEGWPVGAPCDGPDTDVCKNGVFACADGGLTCGPESPANIQEQCNGVDDDCDGGVDEGCE